MLRSPGRGTMLEGCSDNFPAPSPPTPLTPPTPTTPEGSIGGEPAPEEPAPIGESAPPPPREAAREGDFEMSEEPEGEGGELTR